MSLDGEANLGTHLLDPSDREVVATKRAAIADRYDQRQRLEPPQCLSHRALADIEARGNVDPCGRG